MVVRISQIVMEQSQRNLVYSCPMCPFESCTPQLQLRHLRTVHSNDPRFSAQCGLGGCSYIAKTFSAYYSHTCIYRKHPDSGMVRSKAIVEVPCTSASAGHVIADPSTDSSGVVVTSGDSDLNRELVNFCTIKRDNLGQRDKYISCLRFSNLC